MWAFNIHSKTEIGASNLFWGLNYTPGETDIIVAQVYTILAMLIFHIAVLFSNKINFGNKRIYRESLRNEPKMDRDYVAMKNIGIILLVISTPFQYYLSISDFIISKTLGYNALYYASNTQTGYLHTIGYLFFPGIVAFLIGSHFSKKSRVIVCLLFGIYLLLSMLAGYRGQWIYSLAILIWLLNKNRKMSKRTLIFAFAAIIILLYILNAVKLTRDSGVSIDIESVFYVEYSPIAAAFFEMGGSMKPLVFFQEYGADIYPYGNTFLVALLGIASSRLLGLLGIKQAFLSGWLSNDYLHLDYGTGSSFIAECFVNGGYAGGLIYIFLFGVLLGKFILNRNNYDTPIGLFISASSLGIVINAIRNDSYLAFKELFIGVFLVWILIKMYVYMLNKRDDL